MTVISPPPSTIDTTLNYFKEPPGIKDFIWHPATVGERRREHDVRKVRITDVRGHEADFSLDKQGFAFLNHPTAVKEFTVEEEWKDAYYRECAELVKSITGARDVRALGHVVRRDPIEKVMEAEKDMRDDEGVVAPTAARFVHIDQSYEGAQMFLNNRFKPDDIAEIKKNRWAIINVWRAFENDVERDPLGLCDARTVSDSDLRAATGYFKDTNGYRHSANIVAGKTQAWFVKARPESHKWYYASKMTPNEVVLIKQFDSCEENGVARRAPHSAFDNGCETTPPRKSVEVRHLAVWA